MNILADFILPAFAEPFLFTLCFPVAAFTVLAVEAAVIRLMNRELSWARIVSLILVINIASTFAGFVFGITLPGSHKPARLFGLYVASGFALACMISILIEWGIVRYIGKLAQLKKPLLSIALANGASYVALIVLAMVCFYDSFGQAESRERRVPRDGPATGGNAHIHHFKLLPAENIEEVSEDVFRVGNVRLSGPGIDNEVQTIPVELTWADENWTQWQPMVLDIDFDGYMDIGVCEYGGSKWGRLHWWLYDPDKKKFYRNEFTRQLSELTVNGFWTDPNTRQIKITRFHGVPIKEHSFQFIDGNLHEVGSKFVYYDVDGEYRWVGPPSPGQGRLPKGRDTFPVFTKEQAAAAQDPP